MHPLLENPCWLAQPLECEVHLLAGTLLSLEKMVF